jgi:hypothetical protein
MNNEVLIDSTSSLPDNERGVNDVTQITNDLPGSPCEIKSKDVKKCCFVELNEGVTYFNLFTYYLVQFSYVCVFTFIDACQDYLLKSPEYYNIDPKEKGTINGDIILYDTLYLVINP